MLVSSPVLLINSNPKRGPSSNPYLTLTLTLPLTLPYPYPYPNPNPCNPNQVLLINSSAAAPPLAGADMLP